MPHGAHTVPVFIRKNRNLVCLLQFDKADTGIFVLHIFIGKSFSDAVNILSPVNNLEQSCGIGIIL